MTEHKAQSFGSSCGHIHGDGSHSGIGGGIRTGDTLSPSGKPMTFEDLPPQGTKRWVIRRKAEVVAGVRGA